MRRPREKPIDGTERASQDGAAAGLSPLGYLVAAALAIPIGAVAWFELVYLFFGLTGKEPADAIELAAFLLAFGSAFLLPLYRARRTAQVVQRSCRLGLLVAVLLPVVTIVVLMLWQSTPGRRDLGMGGLILYNLPFIALAMAAVLGVAFALGSRAAARRTAAR